VPRISELLGELHKVGIFGVAKHHVEGAARPGGWPKLGLVKVATLLGPDDAPFAVNLHQDRFHARTNDVAWRLRIIFSIAEKSAERSWCFKRCAEHGGVELVSRTSRFIVYVNNEQTNVTTFHGVSANKTADSTALRVMVAIDIAAPKAMFDSPTAAQAVVEAAVDATFPGSTTDTLQ
jgi:hypothetical protein